jgi:hypothetical protein
LTVLPSSRVTQNSNTPSKDVAEVGSYDDTLLVEKHGDRLFVLDQPNFIDNMRQVYARSEAVN